MRVIFDCLHEHGLKLKPTKCDLFRTELIYLAHHVSKDGIKPSKKNVTSIIACSSPETYTDIQSFTGVVGHYRHFIKGFAHIVAPLYDLISGVNKDKKSESMELSPEALEAFNILKEKCVKHSSVGLP